MTFTNLVAGSYGQAAVITVQEDGAALDISAFTTQVAILEAPDGTLVSLAAAFSTDGTDGLVTFTFAAGNLHEPGRWKLQINLSNATQDIRTDSLEFIVSERLATMILRRGDSWTDDSIDNLGDLSGRTMLWFTAKTGKGQADAAAVFQIEESGGLLFINGAAAGTSANGSITVTDVTAGNITIVLDEVETAKLGPGTIYWDVQVLDAGAIKTLGEGTIVIPADVTRATS